MLGNLSRLNVAVLGAGPRALATAICLSKHHAVTLGEAQAHRTQQRVARLPMYPEEAHLDELFQRTGAKIRFTDMGASALAHADLVVVAEQPEFRYGERRFNMGPIERCLDAVRRHNPRATVILEAATPVGYALRASLEHRIVVIPAPLLLRDGNVAGDRAQPQRIIVGSLTDRGLNYAFVSVRSTRDPNTPFFLTNSNEAETIHAFERKRMLRGHSESLEEVVAYCRERRLNEEQVLLGLQPLAFVHQPAKGALLVAC